MQNYRQIFVNIVVLFTRSAYRRLKYTEDSYLGFSEIVRLNRREAIVAKIVLSLTRLSFPLLPNGVQLTSTAARPMPLTASLKTGLNNVKRLLSGIELGQGPGLESVLPVVL